MSAYGQNRVLAECAVCGHAQVAHLGGACSLCGECDRFHKTAPRSAPTPADGKRLAMSAFMAFVDEHLTDDEILELARRISRISRTSDGHASAHASPLAVLGAACASSAITEQWLRVATDEGRARVKNGRGLLGE